MSLARTLKNIKKGSALIVTPRIDQWLIEHSEGITLRPENMAILADLLSKSTNSDRSGRFGASSRGDCHRQQVFKYLGMPGMGRVDPVLANLFNDGTWRHLRWQMMGLEAGVFTHVEVPVSVPQLRLKISLDGLNDQEEWGFELKGASNYLGKTMAELDPKHMLQVHTQLLATGYDRWVYVVEDKRSQEWREFVITKDAFWMRQVKKELAILNEAVEHRKLPGILPECQAQKGAYQACPFARKCLAQSDWFGDDWPDEGQWPDEDDVR